MITQNGESSRNLLLSLTNRKALAPGRHSQHYYQSLSHNSTRSWVLAGEKGLYFDRLPFNRWLELLTVKYLAGWHFGIKGCSSKTRFISTIFRLLCIALWHYVREHIIYTVYSDYVLIILWKHIYNGILLVSVSFTHIQQLKIGNRNVSKIYSLSLKKG